jgi:hypothetical protein
MRQQKGGIKASRAGMAACDARNAGLWVRLALAITGVER